MALLRKKIQPQIIDVNEQIAHALREIKSMTLPQSRPTWKLDARKRQDWDFTTAVVEGYNVSAIVYACVDKRAKLVASVPWKAYKNGEEQENSDLQRLIDNPNPDLGFYELMYNASQSLDLNGMSYISMMRAGVGNLPQELWYLPPQKMTIKPGKTQLVDMYYHDKTAIQPDEMAVLRMPNPADPIFGQPVLMAAGRATDIDRESGIWQKVSLENRGAADINIKLPEGATAEQVKSVKQQYKDQQAGPKNARKALVSNADIQQLNQSALEMDFVASRRAVWTEICAVFGMSLSNLGMTEDVNLANAQAMDKALWKNTIIPQIELMRRQLTHSIAKAFGPEWELRPDLTNIEALQEDRGAKLEAASKLFNMGVPFKMINEKLELGLDAFDGDDVGYVPSGLIPSSYDDDANDDGNAVDEAYGANTDET